MEQAVVCQVERLDRERFNKFWPFISEEMDKVPHIWDKWWTKESIYTGVMMGRFQVWAAGEDGFVHITLITQIAEYPANTILQGIMILGNNLEKYASVLDAALEKWAKDSGCTLCEVMGRPGWAKFLKRFGFSNPMVVLHRVVSEQRVQ